MKTYILDCTEHLACCFSTPFKHLKPKIQLDYEERLYLPRLKEVDLDFLRNDWAVLAFRAFRIIAAESGRHIESFCIVGTGIGLDALGAIEAFSPSRVVVTDILESVAHMATWNIQKNLSDESIDAIQLSAFGANLFDNDVGFDNLTFDLVYENLPNLPEECAPSSADHQPFSASFAEISQYGKIPESILNNLLFTHYAFLIQARSHLTKNGLVLCNIGGRVPRKIILEMFVEVGYNPRILIYDVKLQNESETNIQAYAKWERDKGCSFTFYPYDKVIEYVRTCRGYNQISGFDTPFDRVDVDLSSFAISANQALKASEKGTRIAHTVYSILAQPF